jgi:hypothetical protein
MSGTQVVTFAVHWILFLPTLYYVFKSKREVKWIYINISIGWLAGILYYASLAEPLKSYISFNGHIVSPYLRIVQGICFGGWVLLKFVEEVYSSLSYGKILGGKKIWKSAKEEQR